MIQTQLNGVGAIVDSAKTLRDILWVNIHHSTIKKSNGEGGMESSLS